MKITDVKTYMLEKELSSSMQISRGGFNKRFHAIVRVETDQGLVGYGEGIGNAQAVMALLKSVIIPKVIGLNPTDISSLRTNIIDDHVYFEQKGSMICAASAIEMACWDIKAQSENKSLIDVLGGCKNEKLDLYASDVYWEEDISNMVARSEAIAEMGIKGVKAHIGADEPEKDLERVKALRGSLPNEFDLMIDLNCGYTFEQAKKAIELWEPYNLAWLEEPLKPYEMKNMAKLKEITDIPIAVGDRWTPRRGR